MPVNRVGVTVSNPPPPDTLLVDATSAKDHERHRRAAGEGSAQNQMTLTSPLAGRAAIMKNKANRRQRSHLLCTHT